MTPERIEELAVLLDNALVRTSGLGFQPMLVWYTVNHKLRNKEERAAVREVIRCRLGSSLHAERAFRECQQLVTRRA